MWPLWIGAAACLTLLDIKNAECRVYCIHSGYDTGYYSVRTNACGCVESIRYEKTKEKRLILPKRMGGGTTPEAVPHSDSGGIPTFDIEPYLDLPAQNGYKLDTT